MDLGTFYIALAVKDIIASKAFYEGLGFSLIEKNCGSIEEKYLVMANGDKKIGLYQDMFPNNTLTFNPTDARSIFHGMAGKGYDIGHVSPSMEESSGPCYFTLKDPDGNPILIDQPND